MEGVEILRRALTKGEVVAFNRTFGAKIASFVCETSKQTSGQITIMISYKGKEIYAFLLLVPMEILKKERQLEIRISLLPFGQFSINGRYNSTDSPWQIARDATEALHILTSFVGPDSYEAVKKDWRNKTGF